MNVTQKQLVNHITHQVTLKLGPRVDPQVIRRERGELIKAQRGLATAHQIFYRLGGEYRSIDLALSKIQSEVSSRIGELGGY